MKRLWRKIVCRFTHADYRWYHNDDSGRLAYCTKCSPGRREATR